MKTLIVLLLCHLIINMFDNLYSKPDTIIDSYKWAWITVLK